MKQPLVMFICQTWLRPQVWHHTWSESAFRVRLGFGVWGLVLRGGLGSFPNWVGAIEKPGGIECPTPVEIFRFIGGIAIGAKNC